MQPHSSQNPNPNSNPNHQHHHHHHHLLHFHHHCPPFPHHHIPVTFCPHHHHCHLRRHHPHLHATQLPCNSTHPSSSYHSVHSPLSQTPVNQINQGQEINHDTVSGIKLPPQELATSDILDDNEEELEDVFVLTDEWAEFFAKSEAKRQLAKQNRKKGRKQI